MKIYRYICAICVYMFCGLQSAISSQILDQEFVAPNSPGIISGIGAADFAQTFTVGISGHLSAIEVDINNVEGNQDSLFVTTRPHPH